MTSVSDLFARLRAQIALGRRDNEALEHPPVDFDRIERLVNELELQAHEGIAHLQKNHEEELARRDKQAKPADDPPHPSPGDTSTPVRTKANFDWRERIGCIIDHAARIRGEGVRRAVVDLLYEYDALPVSPVSPEAPRTDPLSFDGLRAANLARLASAWPTEDPWAPWDWSNATAGEVGEACVEGLALLTALSARAGAVSNLTKKMNRVWPSGQFATAWNKPEDQRIDELANRLADELADVVIYADLLASKLGKSLGACVREKFNSKSNEIGSSVRLDENPPFSAPLVSEAQRTEKSSAPLCPTCGRMMEWSHDLNPSANLSYRWRCFACIKADPFVLAPLPPPGGAAAQKARLPGFVEGDPRFYCKGCGIEKATCDRHRLDGKACCPDCDHGTGRAPALLASEIVNLRVTITRLTAQLVELRAERDTLNANYIDRVLECHELTQRVGALSSWPAIIRNPSTSTGALIRAEHAEAEVARVSANAASVAKDYREMCETFRTAGLPVLIPSDSLPPHWQVAQIVMQTLTRLTAENEKLMARCMGELREGADVVCKCTHGKDGICGFQAENEAIADALHFDRQSREDYPDRETK